MTSGSEPSESGAPIAAVYFDGQRSESRPVSIAIEGTQLRVFGSGVDRLTPLAEIDIPQPLGSAPRLLRFQDGAFCSVDERERLTALLAAHGVRPAPVTQWEGSVRWIGISVAAFLVLLIAGYRYLVPAVAGAAAGLVPASIVDAISEQSLAALDGGVFEPAVTPAPRQERLARRFSSLRFPEERSGSSYRVVFRRSEALGPNALALPSGTIVVTDALVALTRDDDDLVAVLAHEAGHVERRHGLRQLFQNSTVAVAVTWLVGDVSMLVASAPTALLQARYSRDLEREADRHAVAVLDLNGIPRRHFAAILERLEAAAREKGRSTEGNLLGYLSSHPVTQERIDGVR